MLKNKYFVQHTVDVYVSELPETEKVKITFHKMTTREKLEISTTKNVAEFLALLNGSRNVVDILNLLGNQYEENEITNLISFLKKNHLITTKKINEKEDPRYTRQIAFFDDLFLTQDGQTSQKNLSSKKITIFGVGAVSSVIAETLVRAGIYDLTLIDYKKFEEHNLDRHLYASSEDVGKLKTNVLAKHLRKINSKINITTINQALRPNTLLNDLISKNTNLVINSCDEPYIGYTSLKLGRYLHKYNIPLYVAGGFDAHLMSSGELVYPPETPCIDCIQKTFSNALHDWKPTYIPTKPEICVETPPSEEKSYNIGGAGGLVMMSSFSAYIAALNIINFLICPTSFDYNIMRYEYLPNRGTMTGFGLKKQENCNVCTY